MHAFGWWLDGHILQAALVPLLALDLDEAPHGCAERMCSSGHQPKAQAPATALLPIHCQPGSHMIQLLYE
jgi:hypothetical protein